MKGFEVLTQTMALLSKGVFLIVIELRRDTQPTEPEPTKGCWRSLTMTASAEFYA